MVRRIRTPNGKRATQPCPCGYHGDPSGRCVCSTDQIERYRRRISGPLLDRIDLQIEIARQRDWIERTTDDTGESSAAVRQRVIAARGRQLARQNKLNQFLSAAELRNFAPLDEASQAFMRQAFERFMLSARAYHRIVKVARTIADLGDLIDIELEHVSEALNLRCLERTASAAN